MWAAVTDLAGGIAEPWLVLGDFNAVLTPQDKDGGMPVSHYETSDFSTGVQHCELVVLRSLGCRLTWINGSVSTKLDGVLANTQWLLEDYQSYAEFLPPGYLSDHSCCKGNGPNSAPSSFTTCEPCTRTSTAWLTTIGGSQQPGQPSFTSNRS